MIGYTKKDLTKTERKVLKLFGLPRRMRLDGRPYEDYSTFVYDAALGTESELEVEIRVFIQGKHKGKVEVSTWLIDNYITTPEKALKDFKKIRKIFAKKIEAVKPYNKKLEKIAKGKKKAD